MRPSPSGVEAIYERKGIKSQLVIFICSCLWFLAVDDVSKNDWVSVHNFTTIQEARKRVLPTSHNKDAIYDRRAPIAV